MNINGDEYSKFATPFDAKISFAKKKIQCGRFYEANVILNELLPSGNAEVEYLLSTFSIGNETDEEYDARRITQIKSAAKKKYPPAIYMLGYYYDVGEFFKQDKQLASYLFRQAAELGHALSQYIYALDLIDGLNGVKIDVKMGLKWLNKSADQKFEGALRLLSDIYNQGLYDQPINRQLAKKYNDQLKDPDLIGW